VNNTHKRGIRRGLNREIMLAAAVRAACKRDGSLWLTRSMIAKAAGCSEGLVSHYLGDMKDVRRAVFQELLG
jgi:hypothetical protein